MVSLLALVLWIPPRAGAMTPATEAAIRESSEALYNLDYDACRARVRKFIAEEPENPFGYLLEAGAIWWQSSNEYGLFRDTPALEGLFEQDVRSAIGKAEIYQKSGDPARQVEGYFVDGMALGTLGEWHLLRHRWIRAYFEGKKAVRHLNKALKIDPNFMDAYLGLGIYDYEADHLPGVLKLSALLMVRGDAKRGLERMRLAIDRGRYAAEQAAQYLATIYIVDEKNYAEGLKLVRWLREQFPQSAYFHFLEVTTLYRLGDFEGSYKEARAFFTRLETDPQILGRKQLSLLCGLDDAGCLNDQELASSIEWLNRAIEKTNGEESANWSTLLHFYRGAAYDLAAQHTQAIDDYEQVLAAPPFQGLQDRAKSCLLNQCDRQSTLLTLKSLSLQQNQPQEPELQPTASNNSAGNVKR